ncbi:MAG TPA: diacylglycerol O-acyltransferase [Acidimicrobiaceae bacterium]|nr:diacylglycerol O-acyltransferase [Acidimicrobiaceae bacterium]
MAENRFMSDSDAFAWYMEEDPALRSTVVGVAWLESAPSLDVLSERLERATRLAPSFRRRPVEPPARLATPIWVTDPEFDLSWHLRRTAAPPPHTPAVVLEMARVAAMSGFDRTRPLWEFTLVDGLEGGGAALVMKFHHSMTDGIGGVQLAYLLLDEVPVTGAAEPVPAPAGEAMPVSRLMARSLGWAGRRLATASVGAMRAAPSLAMAAARHPGRVLGRTSGVALSVGRTVRPVRSTLSPLIVRRGRGRNLHMLTVDLRALKQAAAVAGGTVNDGFMAGITGGLRLYHERHGAKMGDLFVTLPISLRRPDDPAGGNRITLQRFSVPAGIADPAGRIKAIGGRCRWARAEPSLGLTQQIAGTLNLLPSAVLGSMLKHVDFLASDVPGFPRRVYLCGAPVTGYYAFGPTIGAALNATLFSYAGTCCIGVTVDTSAVPDDAVLADCLRSGFDEVLGVAERRERAEEVKAAAPC